MADHLMERRYRELQDFLEQIDYRPGRIKTEAQRISQAMEKEVLLPVQVRNCTYLLGFNDPRAVNPYSQREMPMVTVETFEKVIKPRIPQQGIITLSPRTEFRYPIENPLLFEALKDLNFLENTVKDVFAVNSVQTAFYKLYLAGKMDYYSYERFQEAKSRV